VTVNVVEPEIFVAGSTPLTVVVPTDAVVANPFEDTTFERVATAGADEIQVTVDVRSSVVPLVYVPVAASCFVRPSGTLGDEGAIAIETSCADVTVSVVEPVIWVAGSTAAIVVVPTTPAVATPREADAFEIEAIAEVEEDQVTLAVRTWVDPSVYVPVAVNCTVSPLGTDCAVGVTAIETSWAAVTVSVAVAKMADVASVALIVEEPTPVEVARPFDPAVFDTCATAEFDASQATVPVRSRLVASLYVPVAVNSCFAPSAMEGVGGVIASDIRRAAVTVKAVLDESPDPGSVAEMVVVPRPAVEASPLAAPVVDTEAMLENDDDQFTIEVMSCVVASVYVPVAVNCCFVPRGTDGRSGVIAIDASCAELTVTTVLPAIPVAGSVAVIVAVPGATLVTSPLETVATGGVEVVQVTEDVRSRVVRSL
jgi:hypothetical protein